MKITPTHIVMRILESTGFDDDVAERFSTYPEVVRNIKTGVFHRELYNLYVEEHGEPYRPAKTRQIMQRRSILWLYETDGLIPDIEAGAMIGTSGVAVRRVRDGKVFQKLHREHHKPKPAPRPKPDGWNVPDAVCKAWGVATCGTLNGVKGRFAQ